MPQVVTDMTELHCAASATLLFKVETILKFRILRIARTAPDEKHTSTTAAEYAECTDGRGIVFCCFRELRLFSAYSAAFLFFSQSTAARRTAT